MIRSAVIARHPPSSASARVPTITDVTALPSTASISTGTPSTIDLFPGLGNPAELVATIGANVSPPLHA